MSLFFIKVYSFVTQKNLNKDESRSRQRHTRIFGIMLAGNRGIYGRPRHKLAHGSRLIGQHSTAPGRKASMTPAFVFSPLHGGADQYLSSCVSSFWSCYHSNIKHLLSFPTFAPFSSINKYISSQHIPSTVISWTTAGLPVFAPAFACPALRRSAPSVLCHRI
jgi:hypothetical protein